MNEREYLAKAEEAEALASDAMNWLKRRHWKTVALEYREAAQAMAVERRLRSYGANAQKTEQEAGDMADKITRASKKRS